MGVGGNELICAESALAELVRAEKKVDKELLILGFSRQRALAPEGKFGVGVADIFNEIETEREGIKVLAVCYVYLKSVAKLA